MKKRLSGILVSLAGSLVLGCSGSSTTVDGGVDAKVDSHPDADARGAGGASGDGGIGGIGGRTATDGGTDTVVDAPGSDGATGAGGRIGVDASDASDAPRDIVSAPDVAVDQGPIGDARDAAAPTDVPADRTPPTDTSSEAGDGGATDALPLHLQLYTFDYGDGSGGGYGWNGSRAPLFVTSPALRIMDDSSPTNVNAGAIRYTTNYDAYDQEAWLEVQFAEADYTAYNRMHIWLKITGPTDGVASLSARIVNGDTGASTLVDIPSTADGNWHEVIVNMSGIDPTTKSTINKIGLVLPSRATPPADAGTGPDGGPPIPSPFTVAVDNIWLE